MILPSTLSNHYNQLDAAIKFSPIRKSVVKDCLETFHIFSAETKRELDTYFLLYWEPTHLLTQLQGDDKSYLIRDGIRYYVIYMELLSPEYITEYKRIRVSFRKPQFLDFGFVLVRSFREKSGE